MVALSDLPRSVCAWCKTVMREGPEPTTHGMCPPCFDRVTGAGEGKPG